MSVKPNPSAITSGTYHMTVGEFAQKAIENAYFLNAAGSHFVKAASGTVNAFEVYAGDVIASNANLLQIVLDEIAEDAPASQRGDVDMSGNIDIEDVTALIEYVLTGNGTGLDLEAANCDLTGGIDIEDVTALINFVLNGIW